MITVIPDIVALLNVNDFTHKRKRLCPRFVVGNTVACNTVAQIPFFL